MTREQMLKKLKSLDFSYIDPLPEWTDVGFTERPIWINSKGYGYLSCDDPSDMYWIGEKVEQHKWKSIRKNLREGTLARKDIEGTSLVELLEDIALDDNVCEYLEGILDLPDILKEDFIYVMNSIEGYVFFESKQKFDDAYKRDWCDYSWDELDNEILKEWINRIFDK